MKLDEIKSQAETRMSFYKKHPLFSFDSSLVKDMNTVLKLCAALELAIEQRDRLTPSFLIEDRNKEIEKILEGVK